MRKNKILVGAIIVICVCLLIGLCTCVCVNNATTQVEKEATAVEQVVDKVASLQDMYGEIARMEGYDDVDAWYAELQKQKTEFTGAADAYIAEYGDYLIEEQRCYLREFEYDAVNYSMSLGAIQENRDKFFAIVNEADATRTAEMEAAAAEAAALEAAGYYTYYYTESVSYYETPGDHLTRSGGVYNGPSGRETYYNLNMNGIVSRAHDRGIEGDYWVRDDGVKMLGDYAMVATNWNYAGHEYGAIIDTSLGQGIVVDTGYMAGDGVDIAVSW